MKKTMLVQISLTPNTHSRVVNFAKDVDCVSITGNSKAATAATKTMRVIRSFYGDNDFQECWKMKG